MLYDIQMGQKLAQDDSFNINPKRLILSVTHLDQAWDDRAT